MKRTIVVMAVVLAATTVASVTAFGRTTAHSRQAANAKVLDPLWVELVGQFENSGPGVTPVTHIHYGYLSYVAGVSAYTKSPHNIDSAVFTFFADGASSPLIANGPFRALTRIGTLTIYRDASTNSDFADPDSFRDGTPVLVARYRQQTIQNTLTSAVRTYHRDTITSLRAFDSGHGMVKLGKVGELFEEQYSGQGNMPGPPSGWFVGSAVGR